MASPAFHASIVTPTPKAMTARFNPIVPMNSDHYRFKRESDPHYSIDSIGPVFRGILPNWLSNLLFS